MEEATEPRTILVLQAQAEYLKVIEEVLLQDTKNEFNQIVTIANGSEASDFLHHREPYQNAGRPDLILLDLNLPGTVGHNLLSEIKSEPTLRRIPVIVLTASAATQDIFQTYAIQGNCYVVNPGDHDRLTAIIRCIQDFWLGIVTLPRE